MKLLNLKNGNGLASFVFMGENAFRVKSLLWDNTLRLGDLESFGSNLDIPEMQNSSFPVTVSLIGIKNNEQKVLHSINSRVFITEKGLAYTDPLVSAIQGIIRVIENVSIYSSMSNIRIKDGSYLIGFDSPVDISNWAEYNISKR